MHTYFTVRQNMQWTTTQKTADVGITEQLSGSYQLNNRQQITDSLLSAESQISMSMSNQNSDQQ